MSGREWLCYTDGSCKSGGAGGWGFHVRAPAAAAEPIEGWGPATDTLAKVMEYRAVAEALAVLPEGVSAVVFSDSESLVVSLEKQLGIWTARDFARVDPHIVESVRRIAELVATRRLRVRFQWVRAHNGNAGNERADALAGQGARVAKAQRR